MRLQLLCMLATLSTPAAARQQKPASVYVLASLHDLHAREESFDYDALRRAIKAIRPDVVVLEVTPEELAGRLETRGRPEYPKVVWPMLSAAGAPRAYAMEAAKPLYSELTGAAGRAWSDFSRDRPASSKALAAYAEALDSTLLAYWDSPARVQDAVTDTMARSAARMIEALVPATAQVQRRWENAMIEVAKRAIRENPGRRVLVLASYKNRYVFTDALHGLRGAKLSSINPSDPSEGGIPEPS